MFIATPTSAWARAGASFVPSPVIATRSAAGLLAPDECDLLLRRGLGEEVVDTRLGRDRLGRQRVVAGDHDRADAHRAQRCEALLEARASSCPSAGSCRAAGRAVGVELGDGERRPARPEMRTPSRAPPGPPARGAALAHPPLGSRIRPCGRAPVGLVEADRVGALNGIDRPPGAPPGRGGARRRDSTTEGPRASRLRRR